MYYVDELKTEIERYKKIDYYINKKNSAKSEKQQIYYDEYIKIYLHPGENLNEFDQLYKELLDAYEFRKSNVDDLVKEIKIIKRLHV